MTQANNRQGQGGGEVVPFIEGGAAPRLDRVARWGGTESNRARAARNGFAFTAPSEPGTVIARLDTTGPEPVGSVSRDGGQTWEDAPRWPAPLDVLPGVIVMSAWRRPDGALVAEGSDGVDRVTKPGEIRTPEDADRLFGVGFGLGRWMRENAGAAAIDVLPAPTAPALPAPAPGQVWVPPAGEWADRFVDADGTVTVATADGTAVRFVGGGGCADVDMDGPANGWRCVGVATEHGRVMVGDGFRASSGIQVEVTGVGPGDLLVRGSQEPTRERFTPGHAEAATLLGWTRTRYAPARAGERYRERETSAVLVVVPASGRTNRGEYAIAEGEQADPAQWERLDGGALDAPPVGSSIRIKRPASVVEAEHARAVGAADAESDVALRDRCITADWRRAAKAPGLDTAKGAALDAIAARMGIERRAAVEPSGVATDALGRELAFDYGGNIKGPPSVDMTVDHPRCRSVLVGTVDPGATLTLTGPARDLRALADAIGRALESDGPHHAPFSGYIVRVQRDELLFSPTYSTGSGAPLAGDTRALAALRRCLLDAMASDDGRATLAQWGAKGPRVEVRRDGRRHRRTLPPEASPAPRYSPDVGGGADAWRWGGDDR